MALRNEILVGRFNRMLQRYMSMKGGPPAPTLASDIQAQFDVEDMPTELRYLAGWTLFASANFVAAGGAGNRAGARLFNPVNSGILVVVERIMVNSSGNNFIDQPIITRGPFPGSSPIPNGLNLSGAIRDVRASGLTARGSAALASFSNNTGAQVGAQIALGNYPANSFQEFIIKRGDEIILAPGDQVSAYANVLNQGLAVTFGWRERAIEEGETQAP